MIDPQLYAAFVLATALLMLMPGPNVAVIVANAVAYGTRFGFVTVAGTASAMVPQLALTALGMTALLGALAEWFEWIRWAGVAWLLWLGVLAWRAPVVDLTTTRPQPRSARAIWGRGFLVSLANPKTLLFYAAFFPQFVDASRDVAPQILLLSATALVVALLVDSLWALAAGRARFLLARHGRLRNRLTGGLLFGAGLSLAMARRG
jgi:threonine/homoserine/homoserine lactone efflux protein